MGPKIQDEPEGTPTSNAMSLLASENCAIIHTPDRGRAVVAKARIHAGSNVLTTTPALSPIAHVIFRPYRREVCGWCFVYDRGREWKIRDLLASSGLIFCSSDCMTRWKEHVEGLGEEAYKSVEATMKTKRAKTGNNTGDFMGEAAHDAPDDLVPTEDEIRDKWLNVKSREQSLRAARGTSKLSKAQSRELRQALGEDPGAGADIVEFFLTGLLWKSRKDKEQNIPATSLKTVQVPSEMMALAPDPKPFVDRSELRMHLEAYMQLLACLPMDLLHGATSDLCFEMICRASHNAFSIRPPELADGDQSGEFMGWGVWPEASFFNHSCSPNLQKTRQGRTWSFSVADGKDVEKGEELCISYLGGDERDLDVHGRRQKLMDGWGFRCHCRKCMEDSTHNSVKHVPKGQSM